MKVEIDIDLDWENFTDYVYDAITQPKKRTVYKKGGHYRNKNSKNPVRTS